MDLDALEAELAATSPLRPTGRVVGVTGLSIRLQVPGARIGDLLEVRRRGREPLKSVVIGFQEGHVLAVPLGELQGVGPDDPVESTGHGLQVAFGPALLGRVIDGLGRPIDGRPLPPDLRQIPVERPAPPALSRPAIDQPLTTGVRALDALVTLGEGQRVGFFAGSGVGKSKLLGAIARGSSAELVVVGLIGERGREVREFLEHSLGEAGLRRSVVVVSTSDAPALERLYAAQVATAIAEAFRDQGRRVLLVLDSITRVARAQREVGLAAGEPPTRRGFPPSVFALLPKLLERAGRTERGSITAIYNVLVEGGDMEEPIADEVRGILDGHVVLNRQLADRGHYPAIDIPASLSRVMPSIVSEEQRALAARVRRVIALYQEKRELVTLGAYRKGSDPELDEALALWPALARFLQQPAEELCRFDETQRRLTELAQRIRTTEPF